MEVPNAHRNRCRILPLRSDNGLADRLVAYDQDFDLEIGRKMR